MVGCVAVVFLVTFLFVSFFFSHRILCLHVLQLRQQKIRGKTVETKDVNRLCIVTGATPAPFSPCWLDDNKTWAFRCCTLPLTLPPQFLSCKVVMSIRVPLFRLLLRMGGLYIGKEREKKRRSIIHVQRGGGVFSFSISSLLFFIFFLFFFYSQLYVQ